MRVLEGQPNFRDLGGYRTIDGSSVVRGQLFRSGDFSSLTDRDLGRLEGLGVRTIVDLRSEPEAAARPDRLPPSATYVALRLLPAVDNAAMEEMFRTGDFRSFPSWETIYRAGIRDHSDVFSSLIRSAADPQARPLVFHCATGKDRTGIAAALLLSVLGVPWTVVEEDFLRSNDLLGPGKAAMVERIAREMEQAGMRLEDESRRHLEDMLLVDASYLNAAHDEIVQMAGSVAGYLEDFLGIDDHLAGSLRSQLLQ